MRPRFTAPIVLLLILGGCSSDNDHSPETPEGGSGIASENPIDGEEPMVAESGFVGRWVLVSYTLDDGTSRSVPDGIRAGGGIGFDASSDGILEVQHDLCDSYTTSYRLDNGILTTTDPEFPDVSCDGMYGDDNNAERSELLRRALLSTQTMVVVSDDMLIATTGQNEVLTFERLLMAGEAGSLSSGQIQGRTWRMVRYRDQEGNLNAVSSGFEYSFLLDEEGSATLISQCSSGSANYEYSDGLLRTSNYSDEVSVTCPDVLPEDGDISDQVFSSLFNPNASVTVSVPADAIRNAIQLSLPSGLFGQFVKAN